VTGPVNSGGCTPDGSVPVAAVPVELGRDADVQAGARHSEAAVVSVNQDRGLTDGDNGLVALKSNIANTPGPRPFTGEE
jgi:hypothetical protein